MAGATVLVIGSGGREHAICWKLSQSPKVREIHVSPGNCGMEEVNKVRLVQLDLKNHKDVVAFCKQKNIKIVVVGPEEYLANGLADELEENGIHCFGPRKAGAKIEADKDWSKSFMIRHNVPTAKWQTFTSAEQAKKFVYESTSATCVVKATGLAAGKGVVVATNKDEAYQAIDEMLTDKKFGAAGETIIIEEFLEGEEMSILVFTDGETIKIMPPSQDHKRIFEDDLGPNTGGMGAYSPCQLIDDVSYECVKKNILEATLQGLKKEKIPYVGVLYAGIMLTNDGPKVLEFNCRFGDPETQIILPLLKSDLYEIIEACCTGSLSRIEIDWHNDKFAVGVILASRGYPATSSKGQIITGVNEVASQQDHFVFHSGTARSANNDLVTNGGRVLITTCLASSLVKAKIKATIAANNIKFDGKQFRRDIAHKGIPISILRSSKSSCQSSRVNREALGSLISSIKPLMASTIRPGVQESIGDSVGLFDLKAAGYKDPILVSGTDGVGTKLKIAIKCGKHDTIGIDLVAMCVNDIIAHGAEPLFFSYYYACGRLDVNVAKQVISNIAEGCRRAGCALIGGEIAEMPGMYADGEYDLGGFAVGAVERTDLLPRSNDIKAGDVIIGLPSSGVHSNGFSLVRKILELTGNTFMDFAPFSLNGKTIGQELLEPTKIYVKNVIPALKSKFVKGYAHITGGGLTENIPRVLPQGLGVTLNGEGWKIPPVFGWLGAAGRINESEMLRTFNCGIGAILICSEENKTQVLDLLREENPVELGHVNNDPNYPRVHVQNFSKALASEKEKYTLTLIKNFEKPLSYKSSGVDIEAGDSLVSSIKPLVASTMRPGVLGSIGSFGGLFDIKAAGYKDPILILSTNGVGTKLKIAIDCDKHETNGMDLVAKCVNDVHEYGGEPLFFLDYYACGHLNVNVAKQCISGIADGCKLAGCALIGGETAEMPGMYADGEYDIAGFMIGAVEKPNLLPRLNEIKKGDLVIGLASSGVHSNGFGLIRKILQQAEKTVMDIAPFSSNKTTIGEELSKPMKIYTKVVSACKSNLVKGYVHITGGGLTENIPRALPQGLGVTLNGECWKIPPVFGWLATAGEISESEMLRIFSCGIGTVLICSPEYKAQVLDLLKEECPTVIGHVNIHDPINPRVQVQNFSKSLLHEMQKYVPELLVDHTTKPLKKVGVLISGSGTNLQALINATQDPTQHIGAEIVLVISNKANVEGLKRAERAGIPTKVIKHIDYSSRELFDDAMDLELKKAGVEIVCLAGFMRILSEKFVKKWKGALVNIHPALLPSFKGANAHKDALAMGVRISGCTVHFVEVEIDSGAIIEQEAVPVDPSDTIETLQERVKTAEHRVYPRALQHLATDRIKLMDDGKLHWKY